MYITGARKMEGTIPVDLTAEMLDHLCSCVHNLASLKHFGCIRFSHNILLKVRRHMAFPVIMNHCILQPPVPPTLCL
jgi:hypothetical protein